MTASTLTTTLPPRNGRVTSTKPAPLLQRLVPDVLFHSMADDLVPQHTLGASIGFGQPSDPGGEVTVWLPSEVWTGIATLIRQTDDDYRAGVAEFLRLVSAHVDMAHPVMCLLQEVIKEIEHDPYGLLAEEDRDNVEVLW